MNAKIIIVFVQNCPSTEKKNYTFKDSKDSENIITHSAVKDACEIFIKCIQQSSMVIYFNLTLGLHTDSKLYFDCIYQQWIIDITFFYPKAV